MAFQAGPYKWTAGLSGGGTIDLGVVDGPPEVSVTPHMEPIRGDNLGENIQDLILRGHTITLDIIFQEWKPASFDTLFPWTSGVATSLNNAFQFVETNMGCLAKAHARTLYATRIASCPADGGYIWSFFKAIPHPDFAIRWAMGTRLRNVPMRFLLLPHEVSTGVYRYYSVTEQP